jgi:hypothetical protein
MTTISATIAHVVSRSLSRLGWPETGRPFPKADSAASTGASAGSWIFLNSASQHSFRWFLADLFEIRRSSEQVCRASGVRRNSGCQGADGKGTGDGLSAPQRLIRPNKAKVRDSPGEIAKRKPWDIGVQGLRTAEDQGPTISYRSPFSPSLYMYLIAGLYTTMLGAVARFTLRQCLSYHSMTPWICSPSRSTITMGVLPCICFW